MGEEKVVNLHQLRTLPPPEKHQEFKFRDKVGAFHNDSLWEGHITQKLGNGRFCVYFPVSEENMVFSKNKLRTHYKWINHNWVFPITNHKSGDHSCSLLSVDIMSWIESEALDVFIEYVMLHNVQQLTMHIGLSSRPNLDSLPLVFCSKSLASLQLSGVHDSSSRIVLSKSLHLHALTSLHLECVYFTSIDNDCAEPFSNCPVSFLIKGFACHQLSSSCNLSFLGPVSICLCFISISTFTRWLQVLANVKILTLTWDTLRMILYVRSLISQFNDASIPCFFRLESLKVKNQLRQLSDGDINKVMEYLLQNSPKARVDIITYSIVMEFPCLRHIRGRDLWLLVMEMVYVFGIILQRL
ncbi:hypothetical protein AAZX31_16G131200 [Glycine max]